jgi:hypothetical protein
MGDNYEYIATYVDDLTIASRNPQAIIDTLESKPNNFKLKGCNFFRDSNGLLCYSPKNYLKKMEEQYKLLFMARNLNSMHLVKAESDLQTVAMVIR